MKSGKFSNKNLSRNESLFTADDPNYFLGESELNDESDYGFGLREQVSGIPGAKVERNAHGQYLVRGRLFDPNSKPKTFNQVLEILNRTFKNVYCFSRCRTKKMYDNFVTKEDIVLYQM